MSNIDPPPPAPFFSLSPSCLYTSFTKQWIKTSKLYINDFVGFFKNYPATKLKYRIKFGKIKTFYITYLNLDFIDI